MPYTNRVVCEFCCNISSPQRVTSRVSHFARINHGIYAIVVVFRIFVYQVNAWKSSTILANSQALLGPLCVFILTFSSYFLQTVLDTPRWLNVVRDWLQLLCCECSRMLIACVIV